MAERPVHALTAREREVVRLIRRGASAYSDIAERLKPKVSVRTAVALVNSIYLKLPNAGDQKPLIRVIRWAVSHATFPAE